MVKAQPEVTAKESKSLLRWGTLFLLAGLVKLFTFVLLFNQRHTVLDWIGGGLASLFIIGYGIWFILRGRQAKEQA